MLFSREGDGTGNALEICCGFDSRTDVLRCHIIAAGFDQSDVVNVNVDNQLMNEAMREFANARGGISSSMSRQGSSPLFTYQQPNTSSRSVNDDDDLLSLFNDRK